jgi:transcriptional regulator with GAF, ATPase, and Fis domain
MSAVLQEVGNETSVPLVGNSPLIAEVIKETSRHAQFPDMPVIITGETGTGKGLVARILHERTQKVRNLSLANFIYVNCASMPESLIHKELFGHERGAYTSADGCAMGRLEEASHGTLFLDEIGDLPILVQTALHGFLDSGKLRRLGSEKQRDSHARIVCATNKDLELESIKGRFRADFLYRISVLTIALPPLRDRLEDIPDLVKYRLAEIRAKNRGRVEVPDEIDSDAVGLLQSHSWPGNVRELLNHVSRAVVRSRGKLLKAEHFSNFPLTLDKGPVKFTNDLVGTRISLDELQKLHVKAVLEGANWNVTKATDILGRDRRSVHRMIKEFGLERPS